MDFEKKWIVTLFDRHVSIIEPKPDLDNQVCYFSSQLQTTCIVLLGDPGAGKTHLFKSACESESGSFYTAATFNIYAGQDDRNGIIYIDGLDEQRSNTTNLIHEIIKKLIVIKPSKIRISCRSADWLDETDLELFKPLFNKIGTTSVINLESLTECELNEILISNYDGNIQSFKLEAKVNRIESLLLNPQTLLMLITTVKSGVWPTSKTELYEQSTQILLNEHNENHQSNLQHSSQDLIDTAGLLCVHLLFSNSVALSTHINIQDHVSDFIGEIKKIDIDIAKLVLSSRLFTSIGKNTFFYSHRTIAEYLAAHWLTRKLNEGLSLTRVMNLIGFEGYPTTELKGLYSWLVTLSNKVAPKLIFNDPFAVLSYGDPANLTSENKIILLNSLEKLSRTEPWFYEYRDKNKALGTLSHKATIKKFVELLKSDKTNVNLKLLIINSIEYGLKYDEYIPPLFALLENANESYHVRFEAFNAILNLFPECIGELISSYQGRLKQDSNALLLRARIIVKLYKEHFTTDDVLSYIDDYLKDTTSSAIGELWDFGSTFPIQDIPCLLNGISLLFESADKSDGKRFEREITRAYSTMLEKVITSENLAIENIYNWLTTLNSFKRRYYYSTDSEDKPLQLWVKSNPNIVVDIFNFGLSEWDGKSVYSFWHQFESMCLNSLDKQNLLTSIYKKCLQDGYDKSVLSEVLTICSMLAVIIENRVIYSSILELSDTNEIWFNASRAWVYDEIESWRIEQNKHLLEQKTEENDQIIKNRIGFEKNIKDIQAGKHEGWLNHCACVYFSHESEFVELTPIERLGKEFGESNCQAAIKGLISFLDSDCISSIEDIYTTHVDSQYCPHWYTYMAAMDLKWQQTPNVKEYSNEAIKKVILLDAVCHSPQLHDNNGNNWVDTFIKESPELAVETYYQLAKHELQTKGENTTGISKLVHSQLIEFDLKIQSFFNLLSRFPNMYLQDLKNILEQLITEPTIHDDLTQLADDLLKLHNKVKSENRGYWLATLFITRPETSYLKLKNYFWRNNNIIWTLRSLMGKREAKITFSNSLSYKNLIDLLGSKFPNVFHPKGVSRGSHNAWDASEFIKSLMGRLSTFPDDYTTNYFQQLLENKKLSSYFDEIRDLQTNQMTLNRQNKYEQLNWSQVIDVLSNQEPASSKDLFLYSFNLLIDIQHSIKYTNTDIYKAFWNENPRGQITSPKCEESCRDRLLDLMRTQLSFLNLNSEPEGHMAQDKRADIILSQGNGLILPFELKCESHPKLWDAQTNQLMPLYSSDVRANGYGIYVVFWFGKKKLKNPFNKKSTINSATGLSCVLESLTPNERIRPFVLDVSKPKL